MEFKSDVPQSVLLIVSIILSPLAVLFRTGCSIHFWVNVVLWLLGIVPGIIHAIYICFYAEGLDH